MKARRHVVLHNVEIIIRLTPAQIRDHLIAIAEAAEWNAEHSEEPGSPSCLDQIAIACQLRDCAERIMKQTKFDWQSKVEEA